MEKEAGSSLFILSMWHSEDNYAFRTSSFHKQNHSTLQNAKIIKAHKEDEIDLPISHLKESFMATYVFCHNASLYIWEKHI